ncbi:MAG: hypothetical protein WEC59_02505, partial [Salibacteraceae bacterium]
MIKALHILYKWFKISKKHFCLMLASGFVVAAFGQQRDTSLSIVNDSMRLDSHSIIPETFVLDGLDTSFYEMDFAGSMLMLKKGHPALPIKVQISFRTFPFDFSKSYRNKDPSIIADKERVYNPFRSSTKSNEESSLIDFGDIEKRGSISRGVAVGNNQNLSVNSSLNLQLSGKLNERFSLVAAIADQNIPIQPDGNTQQLQDFDQVYLQVFDDNNRITAGDFQIVKNDGYFMQFNKRLQGGRVESRFVPIDGDSSKVLKLEASGAVSRGKFARKTIQGIEGNQGPYRLTGAENEPFVVILAGTERVYLDGRLLGRGQENDYVINYNTAELTFTANMPITKDRRIVVEYQYSDRNYARSMIYGAANYSDKRSFVDLAFYTEQDAKNQSLQQDLTDAQKDVLRNAGDNLDQAIASSVDSIGYSENQLLYDRIDTTYYDPALDLEIPANGVLVYSTDPERARYQATFSNVGVGNGNYVFQEQLAFGRVYRWVPPVDGVPQGTHEPVIRLVSPKQRQMITARGQYKINENIVADIEWAGSRNDLNTFSGSDSDDDLGMGTRIKLTGKQPFTENWHALGNVDYEFLHRNFQEIERFRAVEFDRDWNIRDLAIPDNQNVLGAQIGAGYTEDFKALYGIKSFTAGQSFSGIQNSVDINSGLDRLSGSFGASLTQQEGELVKSDYYQHNTLIKIPLWKLQLGYKDVFEENLRLDPES